MALEKQPPAKDGTTKVTFSVPVEACADHAALLGEFNNWAAAPMEPLAHGGHELTVELESGQAYRFRYLLDGHRWENDWRADAYVPNDYGSDDSVIDLVAINDQRSAADVLDAKPTRSRRKGPAGPG